MRIFIAIELPEHIKSKIFHEFEILKKKNFVVGKFTKKENLHLTLKFFGESTESEVEKIKKGLHEIKLKPFSCKLGKTGFFDENYIRVVWMEAISGEAKNLYETISRKFKEIKPDYKDFNSHITAIRVESVKNKEGFLEEIKKIYFKKLGFEVEEFVLMKSELFPEGPKYKILERFGLKN